MFAQVKLMMTGKFQQFHKKLSSSTDLESRVLAALEILEYILPLDVQYEVKDSKTSEKLRREADQLFFIKKGKSSPLSLLDALELYSKSIALAESRSRELALAYANRSAILFNLKKFAECERDINRALKLNYPDHLKANLLIRKAKCLKLLGKPKVEDVCDEARHWLEYTNADEQMKETLEKKIQITANYSKLPELESNRKSASISKSGKNEEIPCASKAVEINYNRRYGRHVVATRDIRVGEILAIEKPYTMVLKPQRIYTHCSHCLIRAWEAIPCPNCVNAMYCSKKCQSEAWKQYHDIECPLKGYFLGLSMNDLAPFCLKLAILAVREAGSIDKLRQELEELDELMKSEDSMERAYSGKVYRSDTYRPFYSLETHAEKRTLPEIVSMTTNMAVIIYLMYTLTPFFGENLDKNPRTLLNNKDVVFLGKLITHHYMTVQINDHEHSEVSNNGQCDPLGAVIYAFCSLFNHSCTPNATRVPSIGANNTMCQVIVAQHPIKKGAQIFDDYGFDFTVEKTATRKELCNKYHFTCGCEACRNDWPPFIKLPSVFSISASRERKNELRKLVNKLTTIERLICTGDIVTLDSDARSIFSTLNESVTILSKYTTSYPTAEFCKAVVILRQAYLIVYGNRLVL